MADNPHVTKMTDVHSTDTTPPGGRTAVSEGGSDMMACGMDGKGLKGLFLTAAGWWWLDPVVSVGIVVVIRVGTWDLLRDSVNLAFDAAPEVIDQPGVRQYLAGLPQVVEVHDLHIWGMSTTETALTAHLVMTEAVCDDAFLARIEGELHTLFGIEHTTIQVETGNPAYPCRCRLAPS